MSETPIERRVGDTEKDSLDDLLTDVTSAAKSNNYSKVELNEAKNADAGTKVCFSAYDGKRKVMLTVQREIPQNDVAESTMNNGLGLNNEVEIGKRFGLDDAFTNHLAVACTTFITSKGRLVAVAPEITGPNLRDYAIGNQFNLDEFREFFGDMIKRHLFLKQRGVYHRDNSPTNVLVRRRDSTEAWTTDLGSACDIETAKNETLHTVGARTVRDPRVKEGDNYSDKQVIYAIAHNMLISFNKGEAVVKYDSESARTYDKKIMIH